MNNDVATETEGAPTLHPILHYPIHHTTFRYMSSVS